MNRSSLRSFAVFLLSALLVAGCSSNEAVIKDDSIASSAKAAVPKVEPARPEPVVARVEPVQKPVAQPQERAAAEPKQQAPQQQTPQQSSQQDGGQKATGPQGGEQQGAKASAAATAFENIYFDFAKSDLRPESRDTLSKNAELMLKVRAGATVTIEGHCDERGSAEYNLALGERRAKSAMQYLITLGVPAERLSTISFGKEKPAVDGHDEAAWSKNRRAEFK